MKFYQERIFNYDMSVFIEGATPEEDKPILALKIGYSRDERGNGRFNDYINNGFNLRILKTIPGGSYQLENRLHHYFKKYNIPSKSREWFYYIDEIIDVFTKCEEEKDLYGLFGVSSEKELSSKEYELRSDRYKFNVELMNNIAEFNLTFGDSKSEILRLLEQILNTAQFQDRLRIICHNGFVGEDLDIFLSYLPKVIQDYYNVLGPERIKELSYRNDMLKVEFEKIKNNQKIDLKDQIVKMFIVGNRYSLSEIKTLLGGLYEAANYKKTPKAVDLKEVFEVKSCTIYDNKKKINGLEIVKIKDI